MCSSQCWKAWRCRRGLQGVPVIEFGVLNCFFVRKTSSTRLGPSRCAAAALRHRRQTPPPPPCIRNSRTAALTRSAPYALKSLLHQSLIQRPPYYTTLQRQPPTNHDRLVTQRSYRRVGSSGRCEGLGSSAQRCLQKCRFVCAVAGFMQNACSTSCRSGCDDGERGLQRCSRAGP